MLCDVSLWGYTSSVLNLAVLQLSYHYLSQLSRIVLLLVSLVSTVQTEGESV